MDIEEQRKAFGVWHYQQYLKENPDIEIDKAKYIYDYSHNNPLVHQLRETQFIVWIAAIQQAVPEGFVVASTDSLKKAIGFMCTAQCHPNNTKGYEQQIEELISSFEIMIQEVQK